MNDLSTCSLPHGVRAPAIARRHLRLVGADWDDDLLESTLLATSELVTNAVLHGGDHATLAVRTSTDTVRVEVFDSGRTTTGRLVPGDAAPADGAPVGADLDEVRLSGRGLDMVDVLALRWGVLQQQAGTTVWFEMARHLAG